MTDKTTNSDIHQGKETPSVVSTDLSPLIGLAAEYVKDNKKEMRSRKWRTMAITFLVISVAVGSILDVINTHVMDIGKKAHASLIPINGPIMPEGMSSANRLMGLVKEAFEQDASKAVILEINSPGGTPTQSYLLYRQILDLKDKTGIPVFAVAQDSMTSGAYMVALAADKIYAPPTSMVGSIGVKMESFGLHGLLKKFDVERRVIASSENKSRFDPYLPQSQSDKTKAGEMVKKLHEQFITLVKQSRGSRIAGASHKKLFSGDYWVGEDALDLGLIDGTMTLTQVLDKLEIEDVKRLAPKASLSDLINMK